MKLGTLTTVYPRQDDAYPGFLQKKPDITGRAARRGESDSRIRITPPVKSSEVVAAIRNYDIGIFLLPPVNFNYENTLPNKLFDFIQARLGIAIGPTPEMAEIVRHYNIGVVADDFTAESLAKTLNQLTKADIENFKRNATKAAKELNAEANAVKLNKMISEILG